MQIAASTEFGRSLIGWVYFPEANNLTSDARNAVIGARALCGAVIQVAFEAAGLTQIGIAPVAHKLRTQPVTPLVEWFSVHYTGTSPNQLDMANDSLRVAQDSLRDALHFARTTVEGDARSGLHHNAPEIYPVPEQDTSGLWLPPNMVSSLRQLGVRAVTLVDQPIGNLGAPGSV